MATSGYGIQAWGADVGDGSGGGGGADAPVLTILTPLSGLMPNDQLVFELIYATTIGEPTVVASYPDLQIQEGMYDHTEGFPITFSSRGSYVIPVTQGFRFYVRRTGGWPAGINLIAK